MVKEGKQMVSGRDGSQSPIAEGKTERHRQKSGGMTASMFHILQREELLGYQENIPVNIANALPGAVPTVSSTLPVSPQKLVEPVDPAPKTIKQRLRSPRSSSQVAPVDAVGEQEVVIARRSPRKEFEDHYQEEIPVVVTRGSLRRSPRKEAEDHPQEDIPVVLGKRSVHRGKEKSPLNSRRHKAEMMIPVEEEQLDLELRKKPKADDLEMQEKSPYAPERPSLRSGRSTRRSRMELQEVAEGFDNLGFEAVAKATKRGQGRRQHKRKAPDSSLSLPMHIPPPAIPEGSNAQAPELSRNSSTSSRKSRRGQDSKTCREGKNWLQYMGDLIMWRDTPKSAFVFGSGSFCVLSSCFTQDLHFSVVTTVSYLALFYLAAVFFHRSFFRRGAVDLNSNSTDYELSEADALRIARLILPPVNALFAKIRELFSGDPATTLKVQNVWGRYCTILVWNMFRVPGYSVCNISINSIHWDEYSSQLALLLSVASVLWLLAECGHMMTIWSLTRLAFFVIFTIPKLYSCYSAQLHGQGNYLLHRVWEVWTACSHKKAVLATVTALAWNLSSITARVSGAFIMIVAFRLYQQSLRIEPENHDEVTREENAQLLETHVRESTGLELMSMPRAGV